MLLTQDAARVPSDTIDDGRALLLPVVGYAEVTGLQYGATAFRSFRPAGNPASRPSTDAVYFAHTAKGHTKAYLQVERWSADTALQLHVRVDYRSYPLPFFGVGVATPNSAEEWYSSAVTTVQVDVQRALWHGVYVATGYRNIRTRPRETDPDGALAAGLLTGSLGGRVSAVQLGLSRDTRDHLRVPREGAWMRLTFLAAGRVPGSDYRFTRLTLDARRYLRLDNDFSLATQLQIDGVNGTVPFDNLPMIGADSAMRGYDRGRYRDRTAATAQVELRTPHWGRTGFVLFGGAGTVSRRIGQLASGPWYPTIGAGLRLLLSPPDRSTARLDLAFGRGSIGLNVGLGEAF